MLGQTHVQFKGGDETGIVIGVFKRRAQMKKNATIFVTNCKVYDFKGKVYQIQTTKASKIS